MKRRTIGPSEDAGSSQTLTNTFSRSVAGTHAPGSLSFKNSVEGEEQQAAYEQEQAGQDVQLSTSTMRRVARGKGKDRHE